MKDTFLQQLASDTDTAMTPIPPGGRPHRILIIDDDSDTIKILKMYFIKERYAVDVAGDGEVGLRLLKEHHHDIVLSDVMMPRMDGYRFCELVRADAEIKMTPIILVTAKNELSDKVMGLQKGADAYLTKPYNLLELRVQIVSLLKLRALRQELIDREKELERIKTLEQVLIAISHHINNATAPISGRAQLIDPAQPDQVQKLIDVSIDGTKRITRTLTLLSEVVTAMKNASDDERFDLDKMTIHEWLDKFDDHRER